MKPPKVYSFGYSTGSREALERILSAPGSLLVDVRIKPSSRQPGWSKGPLERRHGHQYVHVPELGNLNYKGGPIELADQRRGMMLMMDLLKAHSAVVLMCVCSDVATCHRTKVGWLLTQAVPGLRIEQIERTGDTCENGLFGFGIG